MSRSLLWTEEATITFDRIVEFIDEKLPFFIKFTLATSLSFIFETIDKNHFSSNLGR